MKKIKQHLHKIKVALCDLKGHTSFNGRFKSIKAICKKFLILKQKRGPYVTFDNL